MAPLAQGLLADTRFDTKICLTAQHRHMLDQVMTIFGLHADYDLNVMTAGQSLEGLTVRLLEGMSRVLRDAEPDIVLVHGDTTTTFCASLAAFYQHTRVGHVEAGLRTGNMLAPWPEEANRRLTAVLTALHFAPTAKARDNLLRENVSDDRIFVTGNTVIDALLAVSKRIDEETDLASRLHQAIGVIDDERRLILVTGHRRENFGEAFKRMLLALRAIAEQHHDVQIVFPVHLNPIVQASVHEILGKTANIQLIEPLDYLSFVYLLKRAYLVITDSGGIQEEAPSLGKPVLVTREVTERPEAVEAGTVCLVGCDTQRIFDTANRLLRAPQAYEAMSQAMNPYGDGQASQRIIEALANARF